MAIPINDAPDSKMNKEKSAARSCQLVPSDFPLICQNIVYSRK